MFDVKDFLERKKESYLTETEENIEELKQALKRADINYYDGKIIWDEFDEDFQDYKTLAELQTSLDVAWTEYIKADKEYKSFEVEVQEEIINSISRFPESLNVSKLLI